MQWVIEDSSSDATPDWARVGVILARDVAPYARAKLRLLNAAHSSLAYLGSLSGCITVADAMAVPEFADFVRALMLEDVAPVLRVVMGQDIHAYALSILERFRNPAIRHSLSQIAWDGSQKLPVRLLGTIVDCIDAKRPVNRLCIPLAGWMRFITMRVREGLPIVDPLAERLLIVGEACCGEAKHDVPLFLAIAEVFPRALAANPHFREFIDRAYDSFGERGVLGTLRALKAQ